MNNSILKKREFFLFLGITVALGIFEVSLASSPPIRVTPSRTDFERIRVGVSFGDRPGMNNIAIVVYNQENTNAKPAVNAWLVIYDGANKYVAGVPVVGGDFHRMKNAISYSFVLAPAYRANTRFNLDLAPQKGEPEGPSYEVVLGEFEKQRAQVRPKAVRSKVLAQVEKELARLKSQAEQERGAEQPPPSTVAAYLLLAGLAGQGSLLDRLPEAERPFFGVDQGGADQGRLFEISPDARVALVDRQIQDKAGTYLLQGAELFVREAGKWVRKGVGSAIGNDGP